MDLPFGLSASAGAVVRVFESALRRRPTGTATLRVSASEGELQFVASAEAAEGQPEGPAEIKKMRPFDPWREPGLDVALACQRIVRASGEIRSDQASADGLAIAFPVRRTEV